MSQFKTGYCPHQLVMFEKAYSTTYELYNDGLGALLIDQGRSLGGYIVAGCSAFMTDYSWLERLDLLEDGTLENGIYRGEEPHPDLCWRIINVESMIYVTNEQRG